MSSNYIIDTKGNQVPIDSYPKTYTYNGPSGAVDSTTATDPGSGKSWTLTYTYSGNNIVGDSGWVPSW